jgi:hypothetical protein
LAASDDRLAAVEMMRIEQKRRMLILPRTMRARMEFAAAQGRVLHGALVPLV